MALTLHWTPIATTHLRSTYEYVAQDNARAGQALLDRIFLLVERLRDFPRMGREGRVEDTRELVIAGTPFVVVYRLHRSRVELLAVFHAARKWPEAF